MEARRAQEDAIAAATGQEPMSDVAIVEEVLGHRSGYHRGMGYGAPIPEERRSYLEQPRDETFVNSDGEIDMLRRKVEHMERCMEMFMSRPPMQSYDQHTSYSQPAPHMSGPASGVEPGYSTQGFASFTSTVPPPQSYYGQYGMSSQPVGQHDIPTQHPGGQQGPPSSSTQHQGHPRPSGFAPWSASAPAFQSASQHPQFSSSPFPGFAPSSGAGPSQQFYPPPYGHHQTSPSTVSASASQTGCGTSSARVQQRQSNRRR